MVNKPTCKSCGVEDVEPGRELNLCRACRDTLANRPMPGWTPIVVAVAAIAMLFAAFSLPGSLGGAIAFERGRAAEQSGKYKEAVAQYDSALKRFPDSIQIAARLAIAQYRAGDVTSSIGNLEKLNGKELDKESVGEINSIESEIEQRSGQGGRPR